MVYPIYRSAYLAAQIEASIGKSPRVNANNVWEVWNIETSAYVSTGVRAGVQPPFVASEAADMTDTGQTYIYAGDETGYTFGHWYYWNGSAWTDGGAYQAAAADENISLTSVNAVQNKAITAAALGAYPHDTVADVAAAAITDGADDIPARDLIVSIVAQQASGTPTPSDPLPISGWSAVKLVRSAGATENLYNSAKNTAGYMYNADLEYVENAAVILTDYILVGGHKVTVKLSAVTGNSTIRVNWFDANRTILSQSTASTPYSAQLSYDFNVPTGAVFTRISVNPTANPLSEVVTGAKSVTISLGAGAPYYGGTLNVTTGKLTVTHAIIDLGTLDWSNPYTGTVFANPVFYATLSGGKTYDTNYTGALCEQYAFYGARSWTAHGIGLLPNLNWAMRQNDHRIYIRDDAKATLSKDQFKTAMGGIHIVYELEEPVSVDLSGTQVSTLAGENHIWADSGNIVLLDYRADPTLYINKKIAELGG